MTPCTYEIWVPSRRRVENAVSVLQLLPTAKIFVDEREFDAYAARIDKSRIVTHPPTDGFVAVRRAMIEMRRTEAIVMIDDDFREVISLVGRRPRKITDPCAILQLIENGVNIACDLDIGMYVWNRNANPMQFFAADPFGLVGPASGAIVYRGDKNIKPDARLKNYADLDWTLQLLMSDRIVLCERRYYFNFGKVWGGAGGSQGTRTSESEEADRKLLARKWKHYLVFGTGGKGKITAKKTVLGMSVRVSRKSSLAATR
jgi:glycosyltransferase involved in cell wall biosynthesis